MHPSLHAFVIVTCARYAVVAIMTYAAWRYNSGGWLSVALLLAFFGGCNCHASPDVCPKCGHVIKQPDEDA